MIAVEAGGFRCSLGWGSRTRQDFRGSAAGFVSANSRPSVIGRDRRRRQPDRLRHGARLVARIEGNPCRHLLGRPPSPPAIKTVRPSPGQTRARRSVIIIPSSRRALPVDRAVRGALSIPCRRGSSTPSRIDPSSRRRPRVFRGRHGRPSAQGVPHHTTPGPGTPAPARPVSCVRLNGGSCRRGNHRHGKPPPWKPPPWKPAMEAPP